MSKKDYAVMFTAPGTDEEGAPVGAKLIEAILSLPVREDGYSYAAFGPATRENLRDILDAIPCETCQGEGVVNVQARDGSLDEIGCPDCGSFDPHEPQINEVTP